MVLVTGGTGLVGAHLLFRLIAQNVVVKATYRNLDSLEKVKKVFSYYTNDFQVLFERIEWVLGDLNDIPALETAFADITQVYHCAAFISFDPNDYRRLHKINAEGTANIANLCIANNIEKLCYVSSIATLGKPLEKSKVTEDTEWQSQYANVYARSKYAAEMEVWRASIEGVPVVIVNPGIILGPGFWERGSGSLFTTAAKNSDYYPPGGTGFVSVHDVTRMMISLMESPIKNERFIAVSQNLTFKEVLKKITILLQLTPPTKKLAFWQLEVLWRLDWLRTLFTGGRRKLSKNTVKSLYHTAIYDTTKAKDVLHFTFESVGPILDFCCEKFREENP